MPSLKMATGECFIVQRVRNGIVFFRAHTGVEFLCKPLFFPFPIPFPILENRWTVYSGNERDQFYGNLSSIVSN